MTERIVCAANRKGGQVILGVRHFDEFMRERVRSQDGDFSGWEQGFVTSRARFVGRQEALLIALNCGQTERGELGDALISEDLY